MLSRRAFIASELPLWDGRLNTSGVMLQVLSDNTGTGANYLSVLRETLQILQMEQGC